MMRSALVNGRVLTDRGVRRLTVIIDDERIDHLSPDGNLPSGIAETHDLEDQILLPGFVDVQVNGGGGVLFGDEPSVETIRTIARAHARFGTTGFLPTIISGNFEEITRAIAAVDAALEAGVPGVLGIHIEGPFLSQERKGIHDASYFRNLDDEAFALLTSARHGKTLVTLAPEETSPKTIRALADAGVVVSAGHTDATYAEIEAALGSGLTGFTHLFNAMSPITAREPGAVGAALDNCESWCGIIVDGQHVDPAVLRVALKCKGARRLMLVTDAMPSVGSPKKTFRLQGREITVKDGTCIAPDGTLAGSHLDMALAVRNAMSLMGLDLATAASIASSTPAAFLGLDKDIGHIAPGYRADLVLATDELQVLKTWIGGKLLPVN